MIGYSIKLVGWKGDHFCFQTDTFALTGLYQITIFPSLTTDQDYYPDFSLFLSFSLSLFLSFSLSLSSQLVSVSFWHNWVYFWQMVSPFNSSLPFSLYVSLTLNARLILNRGLNRGLNREVTIMSDDHCYQDYLDKDADQFGRLPFVNAVSIFQSEAIFRKIKTIRLHNLNDYLSNPHILQSDPDLVTPDLVTPRFSDRINFPRYRKLTVFDPDLVPTPI
eukprot:sb/3469831/